MCTSCEVCPNGEWLQNCGGPGTSWLAARQACEAAGTNIILSSDQSATAITAVLNSNSIVFLGAYEVPGSDQGSGNFQFADGTIYSTSYNSVSSGMQSLTWGPGEEDNEIWWNDYYDENGPMHGLCLAYGPGHGVVDVPCDLEVGLVVGQEIAFLCEDGQTIQPPQGATTSDGTCQECLPCDSGAQRTGCPGVISGVHRHEVKASLGSPGLCTPCTAGRYGFECAESCPAHATSLTGSTSVDDCFCFQGYDKVDIDSGGWECQLLASTYRFPSTTEANCSAGVTDVFYETFTRYTAASQSTSVMNTLLRYEVPLATSSAFSRLPTCDGGPSDPTVAALSAAVGTVVPPLIKCSHSSDPQACATVEKARTADATDVDGMSSFDMSSSVGGDARDPSNPHSLTLDITGEVGPIPLEGLNLAAGFTAQMQTAWSDRQFMGKMGTRVSLESNGYETGIFLNSSIAGANSIDGRQYAAGAFSTRTFLSHQPTASGVAVKTSISFASSSTPKNDPFQPTGQDDDAACAALSSLDSLYGANLNFMPGLGSPAQGWLQAFLSIYAGDAWPGETLGFFEQEPLAYFLGKGPGTEHSMLVNRCNSDLNRPFLIFSATKVVTTFILMKLVDENRLGLDDYVHQHLSWWSTTGPKSDITLRHLLSFTSGLGENDCVFDVAVTMEQCARDIHANSFGHLASTPGVIHPEASQVDPDTVQAGQYWLYSSSHLHIAAAMAEAETGENLNTLYMRMFSPQDTDAYSGFTFPSRSERGEGERCTEKR